MDFNPTARWLLCVTADLTVVVIPIYFIMVKAADEKSESGKYVWIFDVISHYRDEGKAWAEEQESVSSWVMGRSYWFSRAPTPTNVHFSSWLFFFFWFMKHVKILIFF